MLEQSNDNEHAARAGIRWVCPFCGMNHHASECPQPTGYRLSKNPVAAEPAEWMINDTELARALVLPVEKNIVTESEKRCVLIGQRMLLQYQIVDIQKSIDLGIFTPTGKVVMSHYLSKLRLMLAIILEAKQ